jgi:hypothetical protein
MKKISSLCLLLFLLIIMFLVPSCSGEEKIDYGIIVVLPPEKVLEFQFDVGGKGSYSFVSFEGDNGHNKIDLNVSSSSSSSSSYNPKWYYNRPENLQEYIVKGRAYTEFHLHKSREYIFKEESK